MQYRLLEKKYQLYDAERDYKLPEKSFRINLLINLAKMTGIRDTPFFQLLLFSKIKNYLRFIVLRQVYINFKNVNRMVNEGMNSNIFNSFMKLGIVLDVISVNENVYSLKNEYQLDERDFSQLIKFESASYPKTVEKILADYKFVEAVTVTNSDSKLGEIMRKKDYVYIKEVLIYLKEINKMDIKQQISPSFSEDFYTDLGELAFNIYTKDNYKKFIENRSFKKILDIGCGNGNYIDIYKGIIGTQIVGVERQTKVYEKLTQKYKDNSNVTIHNKDIIDIHFDGKFDMINMSYMLFYLTYEEKISLFTKLKEILHEEGSIIVCQYYPDFNIHQELIARHYKNWDLISRFKYDICNSILQAEVLLNNMLIDFAQAEEWDSFLEILNFCGFKVDEISPADDTYYSYFITITHI